jgi:hypothetical protein
MPGIYLLNRPGDVLSEKAVALVRHFLDAPTLRVLADPDVLGESSHRRRFALAPHLGHPLALADPDERRMPQ